jgi:hypothetical protein
VPRRDVRANTGDLPLNGMMIVILSAGTIEIRNSVKRVSAAGF